MQPSFPPLTIVCAAPRGFCAGVDRAIHIVEAALTAVGTPVYVRHEIVHNRFVVDGLKDKGAIFVDELTEVPDGATVIFSAHGVPKSVTQQAKLRGLRFIDAACPLVTKVHREAEQHHSAGRQILMIGHKGHPEVIGTMGQVPIGAVHLVETVADAEAFAPNDPDKLAYITQTTLSVEDAAAIIAVLTRRFPTIVAPGRKDICYATTNRQQAVQTIAAGCDAVMVIGAPNSSNSRRLVEVAHRAGCEQAMLVQRAADINWQQLTGTRRLGLTAGASAPEVLVEEVISAARKYFSVTLEEVRVTEETVAFVLPSELRQRS